MKVIKQMITGILTAIIIVAVTLLVLNTLPVKNTIEGNTLTTISMLGTKFIFQITGNGRQYFFRKGGINYFADLTEDITG